MAIRREFFQLCKKQIRQFMHDHYTDERLIQLLDHARSGKLSFRSCCCFVGVVTADHEDGQLRGMNLKELTHLFAARHLYGAHEAENAFMVLGLCDNKRRLNVIIPMILAEFRRRGRLARQAKVAAEAVPVL